ncbi:energy-coupling factor ABC transporter permease [Treponema primitia]|uniref:energy-coupling factor ABC transporter permease n=1 Tax=Treponema primitia TaxID=88058 RepID=UPI000255509E|nr:energy-coupling factor ABC transporter permease [Treponema primitia]
MHMADALISPAVGGVLWAASAASVACATVKIKNELGDKKIPIMAVAGAFVFAAQMINFTIPGTGSSGHIGGGILLAGLLGPFPALLTIAAVLVIQCLFFADGGLLALGCNIFNMGVIPTLLIYPLIFKPFLKKGITTPRLTLASIVSVVIGLQLGAFGVVLETLASGITALPFSIFVLLMQPIHLAIGVVEGIVTAAVLGFVYAMRPEIIQSSEQRLPLAAEVPIKKPLIALVIITVLVGGILSIFASAYPDGLEWAMEKTAGTTELEAEGPAFRQAGAIQEATAFMPDYDFPNAGEEGSGIGTTVAGIVGAALTCLLAGAAGFIIHRVKNRHA